jgi:hypothetical protein
VHIAHQAQPAPGCVTKSDMGALLMAGTRMAATFETLLAKTGPPGGRALHAPVRWWSGTAAAVAERKRGAPMGNVHRALSRWPVVATASHPGGGGARVTTVSYGTETYPNPCPGLVAGCRHGAAPTVTGIKRGEGWCGRVPRAMVRLMIGAAVSQPAD